MKLKRFLKQETVLSVAAVLAVLSMFFVPPDADYLGYIDLRALAILFSLMTIMAGLRRQGVLTGWAGRCWHGPAAPCSWCSFWSGCAFREHDHHQRRFPADLCPLYLCGAERPCAGHPPGADHPSGVHADHRGQPWQYAHAHRQPTEPLPLRQSGMSMAEFLLLMFPYTVVSLLLLVGWAVAVCRKQASSCIGALPEQPNTTADRKIILLDAVLFAVCLLAVVRYCPTALPLPLCWSVPSALTAPLSAMWITPAADLCGILRFIGNLGRIPAFRAGCKPSSPGGKCWWQFWLRRSPAMFPLPCSCPGSRMKPPRLSSARISAALAP